MLHYSLGPRPVAKKKQDLITRYKAYVHEEKQHCARMSFELDMLLDESMKG